MKITFFGTTTLLFDDGKDQVLFDAHLTRPSIGKIVFGKLKTDTGLADRIRKEYRIDRLRAIFVSHSHYDHVLDAAYLAKQGNAILYGSRSTVNVGRGGGMAEEQMVQFQAKETYEICDYKITVLPSRHSKAKWYNNDLGQEITEPLSQPAKSRAFKEGGSYDFLVEHGKTSYLIRPSFHYVEGELDRIKADVVFLGITGMADASGRMKKRFFAETLEKVKPRLVIPIHWDNFFTSLDRPVQGIPKHSGKTSRAMHELTDYCRKNDISFMVQLPLAHIEIPEKN